MPKQEAFANDFNTTQNLSPSNGLPGNFRADHLAQVNGNNQTRSQSTKLRWSAQSLDEFSALVTKPQTQRAGQFATEPQQTELVSGSPSTFSTEPVQTERTPQFSVPGKVQLPSTPLQQQQGIPATPTRLWEEMTDPLLEAMMQQARAGLYVVPQREDEVHS
jgi:hypothetical protein